MTSWALEGRFSSAKGGGEEGEGEGRVRNEEEREGGEDDEVRGKGRGKGGWEQWRRIGEEKKDQKS